MYKISELIGKQSITLLDADSHGVVAGAYFDANLTKCRYFLLLNDEDENRYFVDYKNLASLSQDAMVIKSSAGITETPTGDIVASPINLPAFNQDGKSLGIIRDIVMDDCNVAAFITDAGQIEAGTILSRSESIVVFNDTGKPIKIKRPVKKGGGNADESANLIHNKPLTSTAKGKSDKELNVFLGGGAARLKLAKATAGEDEKSFKVETPLKVSPYPANNDLTINKYYFLLGKRLQRSIYNDKGGLIARENDLITETVIQNAKQGGKLVAIALHSI